MRLAVCVIAAIATTFAVAIVAAIVELYLTGHGYSSVTGEIIHWSAGGVHLSAADIVLLIASIGAAILTWRLTAPDPP